MRNLLPNTIRIAVLLLASSARCDNAFPVAPVFDQEPGRARLIAAARAGGDYLVRMQKPDGSFHYYYDPAEDRFESRRYNIVRHAGTALSLLDLYAATRDGRYLASSRRAITFLKTRFRAARSGQSVYVLDFDGKAVAGLDQLHRLLTVQRAQQDIPIRLMRRGKLLETTIRPETD